jgi:YD repeat-containing protein
MKILWFLALMSYFIISPLSAGVNLKNGNFYISYTDIVVPGGGTNLKITRTYNSKSIKKGWFGMGWGSNFETRLWVSADGSVIIREYGGGAVTRFTPKEDINVKDAVGRIFEAMAKEGLSVDGSYGEKLRKDLSNNAELRRRYAKKHSVSVKLAAGSELFSVKRGFQKVIKLKDGYGRIHTSGKKEIFDEDGKLLKISHKNGHQIKFNYKGNKLVSIKDSDAKQIFLKWYGNGFVKSISSVGKNNATYKYDGKNLVEAKDIGGNFYKYSYDDKHNMTSIIYADKSTRRIEYTNKSGFVSQISSRDGSLKKYTYGSDSKNKDLHYWTTVTKENDQGVETSNRYEYELRRKQDGSIFTYRVLTIERGLKTETTYNECCSLPVKIETGFEKESTASDGKKFITTFTYNDRGLLTEKESSSGKFVKLNYHKKFNKITKVIANSGTTKFKYDKRGHLAQATNDKGRSVLLIYDRLGRIGKMVDYNKETKRKRSLSFKYNSVGKPIEIAMSKVGQINVSYDNYGNIKRVKSKSGSKIAAQVTAAFQALLGIIRPAGVNLSSM